jgi:two-component system chemotaxis response regulator CheB
VDSTKIRVLIVDDSAIMRQTLCDVLSSDPEIEIIATASDPFVAADRIADEVPDVITLDIEMPRMDGLTFLKKIMSQHPIPVVICSSLAEEGAQSTFKALEYGAVEIVTKPRLAHYTLQRSEGRGASQATHSPAQPHGRAQAQRRLYSLTG